MENIVADLFAAKDNTSTGTSSATNFRSNVNPANIKVVGVGGGGGNAVNRMIRAGLSGVEFWLLNTDLQALTQGQTPNRIQLGSASTQGLGAGNDPSVGEKAAEEAHQEITQALDGADMVFITAGMGGGTGTGAAPIVAKIAKELGILTVAVVTKPFSMEGPKRQKQANAGLDKLKEFVDSVIVIPNDKLLQFVDRQCGLLESFGIVDDVLLKGVQGLTDIITVPGVINVDFADVKTVMSESGSAIMGIGKAQGEGRAVKAAQMAINSQLLECDINGASGVIVNITGGPDVSLLEINDAASIIHDVVLEDATVILGTAISDDIKDGSIQITVIATGFELRNNSSGLNVTSFGTSNRAFNGDVSKLNPSDYFSGAFNTQPKSVMDNGSSNKNFTNIEIPDFLKG